MLLRDIFNGNRGHEEGLQADCSAAGELTCKASTPSVVLTREKGKNGKVARLLDERHISWVELPLVETVDGPDRSVCS